jgi:SAM-dependent methyltransferase
MPSGDWLDWIAALPAASRDSAVDARLGIGMPPPSCASPGEHLIGYHASGVSTIVRALLEVPVTADDILVDLGSGLGRVVLLARLLTGATARGIELQPSLVERAREAAARVDADVQFARADVRDADIGDGTVFFLYTPFTGPVLAEVARRLHDVACRRAIVVCALGIDLDRDAPWLVRRPIDSFWLTVYDSAVPGVPARSRRYAALGRAAVAIAFEREPAPSVCRS